jgi:hypothetical protein
LQEASPGKGLCQRWREAAHGFELVTHGADMGCQVARRRNGVVEYIMHR